MNFFEFLIFGDLLDKKEVWDLIPSVLKFEAFESILFKTVNFSNKPVTLIKPGMVFVCSVRFHYFITGVFLKFGWRLHPSFVTQEPFELVHNIHKILLFIWSCIGRINKYQNDIILRVVQMYSRWNRTLSSSTLFHFLVIRLFMKCLLWSYCTKLCCGWGYDTVRTKFKW